MRDPGRFSFDLAMWTVALTAVVVLVAPTVVIFITSFKKTGRLPYY